MKSLPTKQTHSQGSAEIRRALPTFFLSRDTCLAFKWMLRHCNQCRAVGVINTAPCDDAG